MTRSMVIALVATPPSTTTAIVVVFKTTGIPWLAFGAGALVATIGLVLGVAYVSQETIRTFIVHWSEIRRMRDEGRERRRVSKAAVRGSARKAASAKQLRADARTYANAQHWTSQGEVMQITRGLQRTSTTARADKKATVTKIDNKRRGSADGVTPSKSTGGNS